MGQDFYRRIVGFNDWQKSITSQSLARSANLNVALTAGPGEVSDFYIIVTNVTLATILTNNLTIVVDSITKYANTLANFEPIIATAPTITPKWALIQSATQTMLMWFGRIPYELSLSIIIQNTTSPDPTTFAIGANYYIGK